MCKYIDISKITVKFYYSKPKFILIVIYNILSSLTSHGDYNFKIIKIDLIYLTG